MRKILYFKGKPGKFKPIYAEAPAILWLLFWITEFIGGIFMNWYCNIQDKIENLNKTTPRKE